MEGNLAIAIKAYLERKAKAQFGGDWEYHKDTYTLTSGDRTVSLKKINESKGLTSDNFKLEEEK